MKESIKKTWVLYLGAVFLVVLVGLLVYDVARRGIYSSGIGMNIAVVGKDSVGLLILRPDEELVSWVDLPDDLKIKIYKSNAYYPLVSLWSYGVLEKQPFEIVKKSLGESVGVVVARVVHVNKTPSLENVLGEILSIGMRTDLSIRDRVVIRNFLSESSRSKKILELVTPASVYEKVVEADGKEFLQFNQIMSVWSRNKFVMEPLLNENVDISINNISDFPGLGILFSKQLESSGLHVIEVKGDKNENVTGAGCLYYTAKSHPITEAFLISQVECKKIAPPVGQGEYDGIKIWLK